jgi:hypothetical protein
MLAKAGTPRLEPLYQPSKFFSYLNSFLSRPLKLLITDEMKLNLLNLEIQASFTTPSQLVSGMKIKP